MVLKPDLFHHKLLNLASSSNKQKSNYYLFIRKQTHLQSVSGCDVNSKERTAKYDKNENVDEGSLQVQAKPLTARAILLLRTSLFVRDVRLQI